VTQHADAVPRRRFIRQSRRSFGVTGHQHEPSGCRPGFDGGGDGGALSLVFSFISVVKRLKVVDLLLRLLKRSQMLMNSDAVRGMRLEMS